MQITLFQIILIVALVIIYLFVRRSNLRSFYRLFIILALMAGFVAVLMPDMTTKVAQWVGIGRGTDLVFYIFIIVVFLKMLTTDDALHDQQAQITRLVRKNAIQNAQRCEGKEADFSLDE